MQDKQKSGVISVIPILVTKIMTAVVTLAVSGVSLMVLLLMWKGRK